MEIENVPEELGGLAKIPRQNVEGASWLLIAAYTKM